MVLSLTKRHRHMRLLIHIHPYLDKCLTQTKKNLYLNPNKYGIFSSFQHMVWGLIDHPLNDDISMIRDHFGSLGTQEISENGGFKRCFHWSKKSSLLSPSILTFNNPWYFTGCYWHSALPLSNTDSPWIFRAQKNVSIQNDVKLNIIVYVNLFLCCS